MSITEIAAYCFVTIVALVVLYYILSYILFRILFKDLLEVFRK